MQIDLSGHIALVTGASSGIGRACALALGDAGAKVVVNHFQDRENAETLVGEIETTGSEALAIDADVSNEAQVRTMFESAINRFGTIHTLVNNAGIQRDCDFVEMSLADWQSVIDVNLTGQFLCAREAAREFCRRGIDPEVSVAAGGIICMSSVHQHIPWAGHANYAASKGGVSMLMETLAQELAHHRIRVNAVAPGAIKTHINEKAWQSEQARRKLLDLVPYGRIGEVEDVARAVVWLASDASDYVTGHTLVVDGGMMLYPRFRQGG